MHRILTKTSTYHRAVGQVRLIPDGDTATGVESAEARCGAVWIAWTRHGRRATSRRRRPLEPAFRSQRHLLRTRIYASHPSALVFTRSRDIKVATLLFTLAASSGKR